MDYLIYGGYLFMNQDKTIALIYPPGGLYQRGEDRCQSNIQSSTATSVRACNDLGYAASVLRKDNFNIFLKDYQTENLSLLDLIKDLNTYKIDVIFMSITNATIFKDLEIVNKVKELYKDLVIILKGAIFFNPEEDLLKQLDLKNVDYLIGGESDFIIRNLLKAHYENRDELKNISGILYKENNCWIKTKFDDWNTDLDSLPFPSRDLMENKLYLRPDTKEVQATISTSRGCPSNCIFCLTPKISGKKLRLRSVENIYEELYECYSKYNIRNFFFKSDTFTINKEWTIKLCNLIIESPLQGKISWVANSRVNPIDKETLLKMKEAGCWLVAFGFESGSEKSLKLMTKGATLDQNLKAAKIAKEVGLLVYGFYLIGFPWEDKNDLEATKNLIFKNKADFIELHIATPFYGTELYNIAKNEGLIDESVLGKDYFNAPTVGTKTLSIDFIEKFRKRTLLQYHLQPLYIFKKLAFAIFKPKVIFNYFYFGLKLIKNNLK